MTFFDNPLSHGHDVSIFGVMQQNAISCLHAKQEIARRIEIFSVLFDERHQNDKTRIITCPHHDECSKGDCRRWQSTFHGARLFVNKQILACWRECQRGLTSKI
jgi:hypothetical protein